MNFRLCLSLFIISLVLLGACAKKDKAVVDLRVDEKVIEVKRDEVNIGDGEAKNIETAGKSTQTAPQKMSDNSEVTVMYDGYGNKLEKRYFKGHPRVSSVLVRTSADGKREILVYGQNGEKTPIDGELSNRLMTANADEIANAAKIYENRSVYRSRKIPVVEQPKPQPQPPIVTLPPATTEQPETTVEEPVQQTPENTNSNENPPKEEVKNNEKEDKENR